MMSADWRVTSVDDVVVMTSPRANVSRRNLVHDGMWRRVMDPGGAWRRVERVSFCAEYFVGVWGRVAAPMMVRFPREGRSAKEDLSGTCKNTIRVRITTVTVWQWSRDSEWWRLQVWNQRRWLKRVKGLTANGCSSNCKDGSNCDSKRQDCQEKVRAMALIPC